MIDAVISLKNKILNDRVQLSMKAIKWECCITNLCEGCNPCYKTMSSTTFVTTSPHSPCSVEGSLGYYRQWVSLPFELFSKSSPFFLWQVKNEKFHMEKNYELSQEILRWEVQKQSKSFELTEKVSV